MKAVVDWILSRPPRIWAFAYLALMFVAAAAYSSFPGSSFYDSNLARESSTRGDEAKIEAALTSEFRRVFDRPGRQSPTTWKVHTKLKGATVHIANFPVVEQVTIPATGEANTLDLKVVTDVELDQQFVRTTQWVAANLGRAEEESSPKEVNVPVTLVGPQGVGATTPEVEYGDGFPAPVSLSPSLSILMGAEETGETVAVKPALSLSTQNWTKLKQFYDVLRGDPGAASDQLLRMLYLSATTITTLGFGDITPVTTPARMFVTIEAVFGVILVGLFLNALARLRRPRGDEQENGPPSSRA